MAQYEIELQWIVTGTYKTEAPSALDAICQARKAHITECARSEGPPTISQVKEIKDGPVQFGPAYHVS